MIGSTFTLKGKTYRNLEAQVLENQKKSIKNEQDITEIKQDGVGNWESGEGLYGIQQIGTTSKGPGSLSTNISTFAGCPTWQVSVDEIELEWNLIDDVYWLKLSSPQFETFPIDYIPPFRIPCDGYGDNNWILLSGEYTENGIQIPGVTATDIENVRFEDAVEQFIYVYKEDRDSQIQGAFASGVGSVASGDYSTATGRRTLASGSQSFAAGSYSRATGFGAFASGVHTQATNFFTHAEGGLTRATGERAHSEGSNTEAAGFASHAEGSFTFATFDAAHAEGYNTTVTARYGHAEGANNTVTGQSGHAEGNGTTASGTNSHAEGNGTQATKNAAHAEGKETVASGVNAHSEGGKTKATGDNAHAEGWACEASSNNAHAEGGSSLASGTNSHAEGYDTEASGSGAHAEGQVTEAAGPASHAEGNKTQALAYCGHSEGSYSQAIGATAHAEGGHWKTFNANNEVTSLGGEGTIASGAASHSEGSATIATGTAAHAEGQYTHAKANFSHAEGVGATATLGTLTTDGTTHTLTYGDGVTLTVTAGDYIIIKNGYTLADGKFGNAIRIIASIDTSTNVLTFTKEFTTAGTFSVDKIKFSVASGNASHAEGVNTQALGIASHAEGSDTIASGNYTHAGGASGSTAATTGSFVHGRGVKDARWYQAVFGLFNETNGNDFFQVGCGSSDTARDNCFTAGVASGSKYIKVGDTQLTETQLANLLDIINPVVLTGPLNTGDTITLPYTGAEMANHLNLILHLQQGDSIEILKMYYYYNDSDEVLLSYDASSVSDGGVTLLLHGFNSVNTYTVTIAEQ